MIIHDPAAVRQPVNGASSSDRQPASASPNLVSVELVVISKTSRGLNKAYIAHGRPHSQSSDCRENACLFWRSNAGQEPSLSAMVKDWSEI